jgi:hypothetical protein
MHETVDKWRFHEKFFEMRPNNFSFKGLNALFEFLEDYEEDTGHPLELDVISLCCQYTEDTLPKFYQNFSSFADVIVIYKDKNIVLYQQFESHYPIRRNP